MLIKLEVHLEEGMCLRKIVDTKDLPNDTLEYGVLKKLQELKREYQYYLDHTDIVRENFKRAKKEQYASYRETL